MINDLTTTTESGWKNTVESTLRFFRQARFKEFPAKVIGPKLTLSGRVRSEADKAAATQLASSFSNLRIVNSNSVVPGFRVFDTTIWLSRKCGENAKGIGRRMSQVLCAT